jgi:hypothetical protein
LLVVTSDPTEKGSDGGTALQSGKISIRTPVGINA